MWIFLFMSLIYMGGWASLFTSPTFRWTFTQWRFFSLIATAAVLLTLLSFILGTICRFNFGKGLARYRELSHCYSIETNTDAHLQ